MPPEKAKSAGQKTRRFADHGPTTQSAGEPLTRHSVGDWGDVDAGLNDEALDIGGRLFSSYKTPAGVL